MIEHAHSATTNRSRCMVSIAGCHTEGESIALFFLPFDSESGRIAPKIQQTNQTLSARVKHRTAHHAYQSSPPILDSIIPTNKTHNSRSHLSHFSRRVKVEKSRRAHSRLDLYSRVSRRLFFFVRVFYANPPNGRRKKKRERETQQQRTKEQKGRESREV